jgi:dynein heavy chain, axonemal
VLVQEVIRYNGLLKIVRTHIVQIQQALRGEVVMSETLENISTSIFNQQVPKYWEYPTGFLSLKPLSSWIEELCDRVAFLQSWVDNGTPQVFWISGFFFPQAFITGTLQNYARKTKIPINKIFFEYRVIDEISPGDVREKPPDGVYIYGLFLEGARWDENKKSLAQPRPKELYSNLPMIWMLPRVDEIENPEPVYQCPLYKVVSRTGTLLTTGHSTNFVIMVELPTKEPEDNWIRRGVACFTSLRY